MHKSTNELSSDALLYSITEKVDETNDETDEEYPIGIVDFNCPCCGQWLGENNYYEACEEIRELANKIAKQTLHEHMCELELVYVKEIRRISERLEKGQEPRTAHFSGGE